MAKSVIFNIMDFSFQDLWSTQRPLYVCITVRPCFRQTPTFGSILGKHSSSLTTNIGSIRSGECLGVLTSADAWITRRTFVDTRCPRSAVVVHIATAVNFQFWREKKSIQPTENVRFFVCFVFCFLYVHAKLCTEKYLLIELIKWKQQKSEPYTYRPTRSERPKQWQTITETCD